MSKKKFNVLNHVLVPKHRILNPEEAREVLIKYRVNPDQLPYILDTDPVVKAIGARPGDIIEITRESPTAGKAVYYRRVITTELAKLEEEEEESDEESAE